ncbi:MAG: DNA replication and repair protein RecF [Candidatus Riflemargulisbacteria bacterium]
MLIKSIYLYNFRTFLDQRFIFEDINNLVVALNGKGKSNLIEAINFFSSARSFKTNINKEIINFGNQEASLIAEVVNENRVSKISIVFKEDGSKKIVLNNSILKKSSDLLKEFTAILISPNDVTIIEGSPSVRRRYLDTILSKTSTGYLEIIKDHKRIVDIKRKILKNNIINEQLLSVYQEQLENINIQTVKFREQLLKELQLSANSFLKNYYSSVGTIELKYFNTIKNADLQKERNYKECLYGSHRDDFDISLNGKSTKKYCSTGEKRLISLLLKLSEKKHFNDKLKVKPVLLLDDAFLGLDDERQKIFYDLIENDHQKILTSTDKRYVKRLKNPFIIRL